MTICTNLLNEEVPVDPSVFDLEYLNIPEIEAVVTEYKADEFHHGSESMTNIIQDVKKIDEGVNNSGYFYDVYPEELTAMQTIISDLEAFQKTKTSFDESIAATGASSYNDDIEKARKMQYRIELQENCESYNGEGTSREHIDYQTRPRLHCDVRYRLKYATTDYNEFDYATVTCGHFDDSGWVADNINTDIINSGNYEYYIQGSTDTYDKINYSFGSNWTTSSDAAADSVRKKLDARGYPVIDRTDKLVRPESSKYSGSGRGVSGN